MPAGPSYAPATFHEELGLAVGIGGSETCIFLNRNGFRLAIDGSGGRKDQPSGTRSQHRLKKRKSGCGVVAEEDFGPHHRLAGLNKRGKVKHGVEGLAFAPGRFKGGFESPPVSQLALNELNSGRQQIAPAVTQIVENDCLVAPLG
jgi:hypothetical protein